MKFKLIEDTLNEDRGETTLRKVLETIASALKLNNGGSGRKWCLHHLDGEHSNNAIENLSLMDMSQHSSYHGILRSHNIDIKSDEAKKLLKENYSKYVIYIGENLLNALNSVAISDENATQHKIDSESPKDEG